MEKNEWKTERGYVRKVTGGGKKELYDRIEAMSVKVIVLLNVEYGTVS